MNKRALISIPRRFLGPLAPKEENEHSYLDTMLFGLPTFGLTSTSDMENILREADETKRTRMRALLKGLVYTGGGRLAIRAAFGPTPEVKEKETVATKAASAFLLRAALQKQEQNQE